MRSRFFCYVKICLITSLWMAKLLGVTSTSQWRCKCLGSIRCQVSFPHEVYIGTHQQNFYQAILPKIWGKTSIKWFFPQTPEPTSCFDKQAYGKVLPICSERRGKWHLLPCIRHRLNSNCWQCTISQFKGKQQKPRCEAIQKWAWLLFQMFCRSSMHLFSIFWPKREAPSKT